MANEGKDETKDEDIDVEKRKLIVYGSRIKLEHLNTQYRLHSHKINYPDTCASTQQQVTCFSREDDNDYWVIKPHDLTKDSIKLWQKEVKNGYIINLQHYTTSAYLHSHNGYKSAVTQQQEVTCYWNKHDENNNWKLEILSNVDVWKRGQKIKLIHCNTNHALHSHSNLYPDWAFKEVNRISSILREYISSTYLLHIFYNLYISSTNVYISSTYGLARSKTYLKVN
eukprot:224771_1